MFDNKDFYPTPKDIALKMKRKLTIEKGTILEPSAGKGDLADVLKNSHYGYNDFEVECIESDFELCECLRGKGYNILGFDWLTYSGVCYYDAIVMNPPFSNGDEHLLKAWEFLNSGEIVCLLNAETLNNLYSKNRVVLNNLIKMYGDVEFLGKVFEKAERPTSVEVALVYLKKEAKDDLKTVWAQETKEKDYTHENEEGLKNIALKDTLGNFEYYYNSANSEMIEAFKHIRKAYLFMNAGNFWDYSSEEVSRTLKIALENTNEATREFVKLNKRLAWSEVFRQTNFSNILDKKQSDKFYSDIQQHSAADFTKENIKGTLQFLVENAAVYMQQSIVNVFDELRKYYAGNIVYKEGWKTNSSYKLNKKIIFPYGVSFETWGGNYGRFCSYRGYCWDIYNDLDRIVARLEHKDLNQIVTIGEALRNKFDKLNTIYNGDKYDNTTESTYFKLKFFKKGTLHIEFKDTELLSLLNKRAAQGKMEVGVGC